MESAELSVIAIEGLEAMLEALKRRGYRVVGPTVRDGAIVYDDIASLASLPAGWSDEQEAGSYRLTRRNDDALFGYTVGPQSWKRFLHPPLLRLWRAERRADAVEITQEPAAAERFALIGVRACELHAIAIQDRVFLGGAYRDPHYRARRENAFIVAVNCIQAGSSCFCVSMNAGPKVEKGFDLALTELAGQNKHLFLIQAGTDAGQKIL